MTASQPSAPTTEAAIALTPDYRLPAAIALLGALLFFVSIWASVAIELFAVFLSVQTATLRLEFDATTLKVYRNQSQIRDFPYADWSNWEIFWSPLPILFYFREVNSIHFLPIIFNPGELKQALVRHVPLNRSI
ncbi:DUF3119 family protein [Synechococcus sp. PCC 7336]|uniref:DUF3119 family protein n=1 Tax=Synechococcus sp. PCC 7336 TaxID=195250 RepID=UPI00034B5A8B|nr:DUF3119 family protein [Synechococcus sp. PCC 7336]